jgi:N-acetylglutamate synthase-like GNAT family acetyltransferase
MAAPMFTTDTAVFVTDDVEALDIHQLRALQQETSWARDRSLLDLQRAVAASDLVVTVWLGGTLVGCARVLTDFVYRAVLCDVVVHSRYRNQGIGRTLVDAVTGHPRLARVRKFTLLTTTARSFYEHLGWRLYPGDGMMFERDGDMDQEQGDE